MAAVDPFTPLGDWRAMLFRGSQAVIDQFLDKIDSTLPSPWGRDDKYASNRPRPDRIRCYLFDRAGDAAVRVWLERATATRVRGGPIQLIRHPPSGDAGRIVELVVGLSDGCVLPAARFAGASCTRPAFGPRSAGTSAVETFFTRLADTAEGEWPLTNRTQGLWDDLVANCLAEQVGIDRAELCQWFEASGWEREAAAALVNRFFADSDWLATRLALMAR